MNLSKTFGRFAGREVNVTVTEQILLGEKYEQAQLDENDPVMAELEEEAKNAGLTVRVWLPGMAGTMDVRPDRLNVHVDKGEDNKWRIRPGMDLG